MNWSIVKDVYAQVIGNPYYGTPTTPGFGFGFLSSLLGRAVDIALVAGVIIFLFMLITGAFQWITSGADRAALEGARGRVTQAIVGLLVLFGFFAIILLIQDFLGVQILTFTINSLTGTSIGSISLVPVGQFAALASLDLPTMISRLLTLALTLGAIVFVGMLILGGIQWITAGGDKAALEGAKQRVTNAVVGIFIVFGLWAALDLLGAILNTNLTTFSLAGYGRSMLFNLMPTGQFQPIGNETFQGIVRGLLILGLVLACVVFIIMLIVGGIQWITAGGDKGAIEDARQRITNALIGITITFAVWAIATLVGRFFGVRLLIFNDLGNAPAAISTAPYATVGPGSPLPTLAGAPNICSCQGGVPQGSNCVSPAGSVCTFGGGCTCFIQGGIGSGSCTCTGGVPQNGCNFPAQPICRADNTCGCYTNAPITPGTSTALSPTLKPINATCKQLCGVLGLICDPGLTCTGNECVNPTCPADPDCNCGTSITCDQFCRANIVVVSNGQCTNGSTPPFTIPLQLGNAYCAANNPTTPQCFCACLPTGQVCSNNSQCCSNNCNSMCVSGTSTPTPNALPPGPSSLTAVHVCPSPRFVLLNWSSVTNASGYEVWKCSGTGCTNYNLLVDLPATDQSIQVQETADGNYSYMVRAYFFVPPSTRNYTNYSQVATVNVSPCP